MKYCATKKEARHDAAKVALLGLNIPVGQYDQQLISHDSFALDTKQVSCTDGNVKMHQLRDEDYE